MSRRRAQTFGIENRHNDLPHEWPKDPDAARVRGRIEDYRALMAQWRVDNPCATREEVVAAGHKIMEELA